MKKLYTLLAASLTFMGMAQSPTLTTAALPAVGYSYTMNDDTAAVDRAAITVSAGSATAQNWDYSANFNTTYTANTSFVAPSSGQGSSSFPNANLASNQGGSWIYFIAGSNGLLIDGAYVNVQGNNVALDFNPNPAQIPLPFTISNSVTTTYSATANTTITYSGQAIPVTVKYHGMRIITADAFGSLKTPAGTYANTLRVKTYEITSDTAYANFFGPPTPLYEANDTTTNYSWYQNTQDALLMSIDQNTSGVTQRAGYLQAFSNAIKTIENNSFAANLYPNPAGSIAYVSYQTTAEANVNACLYDITGKQVASFLNNQPQGMGKQTLAIDLNALNLPKGLYMLQLSINGESKTLKMNVE